MPLCLRHVAQATFYNPKRREPNNTDNFLSSTLNPRSDVPPCRVRGALTSLSLVLDLARSEDTVWQIGGWKSLAASRGGAFGGLLHGQSPLPPPKAGRAESQYR